MMSRARCAEELRRWQEEVGGWRTSVSYVPSQARVGGRCALEADRGCSYFPSCRDKIRKS